MKSGSMCLRRNASRMLCGIAWVSVVAPAMAQDLSGGVEVAGGEEIVVTGSRVRDANMSSISPVISVGAEEIRLQGSARVEDVLNTLPSVSPSQSGQVNALGNGTATIDLRQLGPTRTLVLIDNIRLMPGDPTVPAADLNNIPASLVKRVEVLTGGASTVYGSDAVAGVVNFILNRDFEGVAIDGSLGFFQHDNDSDIQSLVRARGDVPKTGNVFDGFSKDINLTVGANVGDGRGNVTAYLGFRDVNGVGWAERDFSGCVVQTDASGRYCGGSAGTAPALFVAPSGAFLTLDRNSGALRPYTSADSYNYGPTNYLQRPDRRYLAGALARYEFSPALELRADLMYMENRSVRQQAPDGVYNRFSVNCDNPLLSADQVSAFCTSQGLSATDTTDVTVYRRNVEGGPRIYDIEHTSFRATVGARGQLDSVWSYDLYGLHARTRYSLALSNILAISRSAKAMQAVTDPVTGNAVCASALSGADPSCRVYNPWSLGGVTQDALDYMTITAYQSGSTTENVLSGSLVGKLGEYGVASPFADTGLTVALGVEYRKEKLDFRTDSAFSSGEVEGTVVAGNSGAFSVTEFFGELSVPIVEQRPFFHTLSFEAGYRRSDYSSAGLNSTYKFGLEWAPIEPVRFRAGYNRAVRAPNLVELYTQQARSLTPIFDPCAGAAPTASFEQCARSGVTASQYGTIVANPNGQYNFLSGGNTELTPETADTYTFGLVFTPAEMIPGLSISVDYFDIKVNNYITNFPGALSLSQCVATGNPIYCSLINRDTVSGSLWIGNDGFIDGRNTNAGSLKTSGVDVNVAYSRPIRGGNIAFTLAGTWLESRALEPITGVTRYDCAGYYGITCGQPSPEWRHRARVTWATEKGVDISASWRYVAAVKADKLIPAIGGTIPDVDRRIKSFSYFDLAAVWRVTDDHSLSLSVNNIFDKTPPIIGANYIASYSNGGTYPGVYDMMGRYIALGFKSRF